jgi:hypothetical protein
MLPTLLLPTLFCAATAVQADGMETSKLYLGGSLSYNTIDSPFGGSSADAGGLQGLVGYDMGSIDGGIHTSMELGISQTDDFDNTDESISGLWIAAVVEKDLPEINPELSLIGRVGIDVGDDDGILTGVGVGYRLNSQLQVRGEFVNKDASNQYLASLVIHL